MVLIRRNNSSARDKQITPTTIPSVLIHLTRMLMQDASSSHRLLGACLLERLPVRALMIIFKHTNNQNPAYMPFKLVDAAVSAMVAVLLQVVTPDDEDWVKEYSAWQESILNRYRKELPKEFQESELDADPAASRWQPAPRVTEADRTNDTKSLQRRLDRRLFLMLQKKGKLLSFHGHNLFSTNSLLYQIVSTDTHCACRAGGRQGSLVPS